MSILKKWGFIIPLLVITFDAQRVAAQQHSFIPTATVGNVFPFGDATNNRAQYLYYPTDFAPAAVSGNITHLYFKSTGTGTVSFSTLNISMGATALTAMATGPWVAGLTQVYNGSFSGTVNANGWVVVTLMTPYPYNSTQNLIVDVWQTGMSPGFTGLHATNLIDRRLYGNNLAATGTIQPRLISFGYDLISCTTPPPTVSAAPVVLCQGEVPAPLTATGSNLLWYTTPTGGTGSPTPPVPNTSSIGTTKYYVSQTTTCESQRDSITVIVQSSGQLYASVDVSPGDSVCDGQFFNFSAIIPNIPSANYQWKVNGTNVLGETNQTFSTNNLNTGDEVSVQVTSTAGCFLPNTVLSDTVKVAVMPAPAAAITAASTAPVCEPDSIQLFANQGVGLTYQWLLDNQPVYAANNANYFAKASGNYKVRVTNNYGCVSISNSIPLTINLQPQTYLATTSPNSFCDNSGLVLTASTGNNPTFTYQWYKDNQPISGATLWYYLATSSGNYRLEVNTPQGCHKATNTVVLSTYSLPKPVITKTGNTLSTSPGYAVYEWKRNHQVIGNGQSVNLTQSGVYEVCVSDANECTICSDLFIYDEQLGVNDLNAKGDIRVYPNPTNDVLNIDAPFPVNIAINDLLGRTVQQDNNSATSFRVHNLATGIYLLKVFDTNGKLILTERVVKN